VAQKEKDEAQELVNKNKNPGIAYGPKNARKK